VNSVSMAFVPEGQKLPPTIKLADKTKESKTPNPKR
jgi:hypothetical protein